MKLHSQLCIFKIEIQGYILYIGFKVYASGMAGGYNLHSYIKNHRI